MKTSPELIKAFFDPLETLLQEFTLTNGLLPADETLRSKRFLVRSVVPHIERLSSLFNREEAEKDSALEPYWKLGSNPANLRLAYFLAFMPTNAFRMASVFSELARLGFKWSGSETLRAIDFGCGPASSASGLALALKHCDIGLPTKGSWALMEQDAAILKMGTKWAETVFAHTGLTSWSTREFSRKVDFTQPLLPRTAPKFNLWVSSYFLNEHPLTPEALAQRMMESWKTHLEENGLVVLIEPALRLQSRKLLAIRKEILRLKAEDPSRWDFMQILLPCLGSQNCEALSDAEDWCHEDVSWERPEYLRVIERMTGMDRKTLPFSYLVLVRKPAKKLPAKDLDLSEILKNLPRGRHDRLVSPSHPEGSDWEFFTCGAKGKRRCRMKDRDGEEKPLRGEILCNAQTRGDRNSTRIDKVDARI